jgi:tight adherence protein B
VIIAPIIMFLVGAGAVLALYAGAMRVPAMVAGRRLDRRIREVSTNSVETSPDGETVVKRRAEGPLPGVDRLVSKTARGSRLAKYIEQSGCGTTVSALGLMTLALAASAGLLAYLIGRFWFFVPLAALAGGAVPIAFVSFRRSSRLKKFEEHFPEALDLLSRAIRAGHAFQTALGMVADELPDPVGPEFKKTFEQQNYGLPLRDSLDQMAERVPIMDVRFFVTAVLIQRETGGNLSEILDNLAHVVRERFKILRQVRVHTAHGRFTAFVLLSVPPLLGFALMMINPDHMNLLFHDPVGQMVLMVAMVMQVVGFFWIRRVIKIEV